VPAPLKRSLDEWRRVNVPLNLRLTGAETTLPSDEDLLAFERWSEEMRGLAAEIGSLVRESWSLAEITEAGRPKLELQTGDYFANVGAGAVIVNRSSFTNAINRLPPAPGKLEMRWAFETIAEEVGRNGDKDAIADFNSMTEELQRPNPRTQVLSELRDRLVARLPRLNGEYLAKQIDRLIS
jgi:hypothetical protein